MKHNLLLTIAILLLAACFSLEFNEIKDTDKPSLHLSIENPVKYYALGSLIENKTDTVIKFDGAGIVPSKVMIYIYYTKDEAERDLSFEKSRWKNGKPGKELIASLELDAASIPSLFIAFKCVECSSGPFQDTFQIFNEVTLVTPLEIGKKLSFTSVYSRKLLRFKANKARTSYGFRFSYTSKKEKEIMVETFFNSQLVSNVTSSSVVLSRNKEYNSIGDYQVNVTVIGEKDNFGLDVELTEFIQPVLIKPLEKVQLNFIEAKHDLYFYVDISNYTIGEENTITFTVNQKEGQSVIPTIYSKNASSNVPVDQYDQLVPKSKEENRFEVLDKKNGYLFLYFKKTTENSTLLMINVLYAQEIDASFILSPQAEAIDDSFLESFTKHNISIEKNVLYHLVISSFKYASSLMVYVSTNKVHRLFFGQMLDENLKIVSSDLTLELIVLQSKENYTATYEFFGEAQSISVYIEPIYGQFDYQIDYAKNSERKIHQLNSIGQTYYFIMSSLKSESDPTYHLIVEQLTGKVQYLFKQKISTESITSLLPLSTDLSRGIEKLSSQYYILCLKVISPGQVALSLKKDTPAALTLTEVAQHSLVFVKNEKYSLTLPYENGKKYNMMISPIQFQISDNTIKVKVDNEEKILKENNSIPLSYSAPLTLEITPTIQSNSAVAFKLINTEVKLKEITSGTTTINDKTVIMKLTEADIAEYNITFNKDLSFKYDFGIGEDNYIPAAYNPTTAKKGISWLRLLNPMSSPSNAARYHYLTFTFEPISFPVELMMQKTTLPKYEQLAINSMTKLTAGAQVSLTQHSEKNLVIIFSSVVPDYYQSMTLFYNRGVELTSWKVEKRKSVIYFPNPTIPLYLKYSDNPTSSASLSSMITYNYLSDQSRDEVQKIVSTDVIVSINNTELTWTSPSENIKKATVYFMKNGTNTSAMDDEVYLRTLSGLSVTENKCQLALNESGGYVASVLFENTKGLAFNFTSVPIKIEYSYSGSSLIWLWVILGIIGCCALVFGGVILFRKKRMIKDSDIIEKFSQGTIET